MGTCRKNRGQLSEELMKAGAGDSSLPQCRQPVFVRACRHITGVGTMTHLSLERDI